jgi:hypothetical protein
LIEIPTEYVLGETYAGRRTFADDAGLDRLITMTSVPLDWPGPAVAVATGPTGITGAPGAGAVAVVGLEDPPPPPEHAASNALAVKIAIVRAFIAATRSARARG